MAFLEANRDDLGLQPICRDLEMAQTTYHEHAAGPVDPSKRLASARDATTRYASRSIAVIIKRRRAHPEDIRHPH